MTITITNERPDLRDIKPVLETNIMVYDNQIYLISLTFITIAVPFVINKHSREDTNHKQYAHMDTWVVIFGWLFLMSISLI